MNPGVQIAIRRHLLSNSGGSEAFTPASLGSKLRAWSEVSGLVNGSTTKQGQVSGGDLVQWNDLSGNGNHWTISTGAPAFDGSKLVFTKANSDGLINAGLFADSGANTQGEIIVVGEKIANEAIYPFTASRAADILKRCLFGILDTDDTPFFQIKLNGSNLVNGNGAAAFLDSGKFISAYRSNGSSWGIFTEKNGERLDQTVTLTYSGTVPNGDWFAEVAPGNFGCMKFIDSSPVYYSGYVYAILYCNAVLTLQERTDLFCYLNNKYSVWP